MNEPTIHARLIEEDELPDMVAPDLGPVIQTTRRPPPLSLNAAIETPSEVYWYVLMNHAAHLIANRYDLDIYGVWNELLRLESHSYDYDGRGAFGSMLDGPSGWAAIGEEVAKNLTGKAADDLPDPFLFEMH